MVTEAPKELCPQPQNGAHGPKWCPRPKGAKLVVPKAPHGGQDPTASTKAPYGGRGPKTAVRTPNGDRRQNGGGDQRRKRCPTRRLTLRPHQHRPTAQPPCPGVTPLCPPAPCGHSSSRAVLSRGDCSTSEFLASRRSSCCSFIFWDLARSQSVLIFSLSHTTDVSVSLM